MSEQSAFPQDSAEGHGDDAEAMRAANTFDLRRIIGGLFLVYGLILTLVGLFDDSEEEIAKAADTHINLYAGLGMLVFAGLMLAWAFARPLGRELAGRE